MARNLEKDISIIELTLYSHVSYLFGIRIRAFLKRVLSDYITTVTTTHTRKLASLGLHINTANNESAIVNLSSSFVLTKDEIRVLSKGLEHSMFPHKLDELKVRAEFENLFSQAKPFITNDNDRITFKTCLMTCYADIISSFKFYRNTDYYFSKQDGVIVRNLRSKCTKSNILLLKADKGNTVVALSREQYNDKLNDILSDSSKFRKVDTDDTLDRQRRLQDWLRRNKGIFTDDEYGKVYPTGANIPVLYGQPKIHKVNVPLRPIMSMVGALNHGLAQWLSKFLDPIRSAPSMCRDSFALSRYLASSTLYKYYFVSYDVVSLFTNIPLKEAIDVILNRIYEGKSAKELVNGVKRLTLERALKWALMDNTFVCNGQLYKQVDGIAMGSPLAPALADIFMNHLLESVVSDRSADWEGITIPDTITGYLIHNLKFFIRYVDDTLACFETREEAERFLIFLNSLHTCIKFTMDRECDFGKIAFLDLWIMKGDNKLNITVYRKPTHSGVYTHFSSFIPHRFKRQLVVTLLERAYSICSDYMSLHREFDDLTTMLRRNGYNCSFVQNIIGQFLNGKRKDKVKREGPEQYSIFIRLPYLGEASEKVKGSLESCLSRIRCGTVRIVITHDYNRLAGCFPFKDRQPKHLANGIVYKIKCNSCAMFYIGETARCALTRFSEHAKKTGKGLTEVGQHLKDNPTHSITFEDDLEVLKYGLSHWRKRKFVETLFLQQHRGDLDMLNDMQKSMPLYLFNV